MTNIPEVLFVCAHNASRSQMAAAPPRGRRGARHLRRIRTRRPGQPRRPLGHARDRHHRDARRSDGDGRQAGHQTTHKDQLDAQRRRNAPWDLRPPYVRDSTPCTCREADSVPPVRGGRLPYEQRLWRAAIPQAGQDAFAVVHGISANPRSHCTGTSISSPFIAPAGSA